MAEYLDLPLVTDSDALLQTGVDYLEAAIPGFQARPGNVETILLEAVSQIAAEVVAQAAQVDPVVFAYFGGALVGIPIHDATAATGTATITWAANVAAVMLDAGSQLAVPHPSGSSVLFETDTDVVAPEGGGQAQVGITAAEPGAAANDCFGDAELINVLDGLESIYVGSTSGGSDEEETDAYLDRLADAFTILAPRPILPGDHATLVRQLPGVARVLAINLLLPGTDDTTTTGEPGKPPVVRDPMEPTPPPAASLTEEPRCTTVAVVPEGGGAPTGTLLQTCWTVLDAAREVNFLNYVIGPSYGAVGVQAALTTYPGYSAADVAAAAAEQLALWLDPMTWGTPGAGSTGAGSTGWEVDRVVRISEAVDYLNRAPGVHWVDMTTVRLSLDGGAWLATDLVLSGLAPLPTLDESNVQLTVNPAEAAR